MKQTFIVEITGGSYIELQEQTHICRFPLDVEGEDEFECDEKAWIVAHSARDYLYESNPYWEGVPTGIRCFPAEELKYDMEDLVKRIKDDNAGF